MSDGFNKLKKAFEDEPAIKASARAKKTAMDAAMQSFEKHKETSDVTETQKDHLKNNLKNSQGISIDKRLKEQDNKHVALFNLSNWRKLMKNSYLIPAVATAGIAAVVVLLVSPRLLNNKNYSSEQRQQVSMFEAGTNAVPGREKALQMESADGDIAQDSIVVAKADLEISESRFEFKNKESVALEPGSADKRAARKKQERQVPSSGVLVGKKSHAGTAVANIAVPAAQVASPAPVSVQGFSDHKDLLTKATKEVPMSLPQQGRDKFEAIKTSPLKVTKKEPVSTFSIDVDTAAYSFMRAALNRNFLPQKNALRIEELINYFPYDYQAPDDLKQPFQVNTTVMPTPWNANTRLLHIAIKGYQLAGQDKPRSNLVFLLDTSGSMSQPNKLPLLKNSFKLLLSTLQPDDSVSIVSYAGSAGTVLEPTRVQHKIKIIQALERLNAGGSTAGGEGIRLAYQLAEANYDEKAVNRVILATDGDFNVGIRNSEELKSFVERKRKSGVFLSVLGFGMGNYNDSLMQTLAQNGNGNAAYIDSLSEARKVLVEEASSTLFTIAKDVKIQMEFNPETVSEYRLIGYETRRLKREDFNNDKVDAGDIGAGHTVTAIYEITPTGSESTLLDPLRYQARQDIAKSMSQSRQETEYGFLKLRYKLPDEDKSKLIETPVLVADAYTDIKSSSSEARFATAVAAFGQLLRGGQYTHAYSYDDVIELAQSAKGQDPYGYRAEFISLVRLAKTAEVLR